MKRKRRRGARLDGRTKIAKRACELLAAFGQAMHEARDGEVDLLTAHRVTAAAELTAIAEDARARYMRSDGIGLDDVVRAERVRDLAIKRLGLKPSDAPKPSRLAEILAGADA